MDTSIIVAVIAAAGAVIGNALLKYRESLDRLAWDTRKRKIPVYARCLSCIAPMVQARIVDPDSIFSPTARVTRDMANWSSPDVFVRYLQFRLELERKTLKPLELRSSIAQLILDIRSDLKHEDVAALSKDPILEILGAIFYKDTGQKDQVQKDAGQAKDTGQANDTGQAVPEEGD